MLFIPSICHLSTLSNTNSPRYNTLTSSPTADLPATQAGAIFGALAYVLPEQAQDQPADERSNIFSFGLILYEMLSGRRAFTDESPLATVMVLVKDDASPLQTSSH